MSAIINVQSIGQDYNLENPSSLFFSKSESSLYICDMGNRSVIKYYWNQETGDNTEIIQARNILKKPLAITMDVKKRLYVTDAELKTIYVFHHDRLKKLRDIRFELPGSITCDHSGNIYVSDFLQNRIYQIDDRGLVTSLDNISCRNVYGIFYYNNKLYFTNYDGIYRYDIDSGQSTCLISTELPPIAVTLDEEGDIYFSNERRLYLYQVKLNKLELILDRKIFHKIMKKKLYHIGAIVSIEESQILFSDTIKNGIYSVNLEKS